MKMQKFYERDRFTYEEKADIARKSNDCCCHCGKKAYINYGATIDHFIPLNRGGSNSFINLVMLCKDCNKTKDNKIMNIDYVPYLKDVYKKKLSEYVSSYVQVMDISERNRLLAYDEYTSPIEKEIIGHKSNKPTYIPVSKYTLKLATWNDLDKLYKYLVKYLKKNDQLDSEEAARENIIFWLQFGSIYYIEKNGEVNLMIAITIKNVTNEEGYRGCNYLPYMYIFPYYSTELSCAIVYNLIVNIPNYIIKEENLDYVPFNVLLLETDKMANKLASIHKNSYQDVVNGFMCMNYVAGTVDNTNELITEEEMTESDLKTYNFFKKFENVTDKLVKYFEKYSDRESVSWMLNSIMSYPMIKQTSLVKYTKDWKPESERNQ